MNAFRSYNLKLNDFGSYFAKRIIFATLYFLGRILQKDENTVVCYLDNG
jgi:hypothetical protein